MTSVNHKAKPSCVTARHANVLQTNLSLRNASMATATALCVAVNINVKGSVATR